MRPFSIKASNFAVNCAIRLRKSSKPKLRLGRESAMEGASADANGGRMALVDSDGSKDDILGKRIKYEAVESIQDLWQTCTRSL